jgi:hypothetical protein
MIWIAKWDFVGGLHVEKKAGQVTLYFEGEDV